MSEGPVLGGNSGGEGEGEGFSWHGSLSADFRDSDFVKGYDDDASGLDKFVKTAISAQSMIGKRQEASGVMVPGADASLDEYVAFYKAIGRPDSPGGYELKDDGFAEGTPRNQQSEQHIIQSMYDAGTPTRAAQRIWNEYVTEQNNIWEGVKSVRDNNERANTEALNTAFGSYREQRIAQANDGFNAAFGEDAQTVSDLILLDGTRFGDRPDVVKAMANHGVTLSEANLVEGSHRGLDITPGEATQEIRNLKADPEFMKAWMDAKNPGHDNAMRKLSQLNETIHG